MGTLALTTNNFFRHPGLGSAFWENDCATLGLGPGAKPGDGISAIGAFAAKGIKIAAGIAAAAALLDYHIVTMTRELKRDGHTQPWRQCLARRVDVSGAWDAGRVQGDSYDRKRARCHRACRRTPGPQSTQPDSIMAWADPENETSPRAQRRHAMPPPPASARLFPRTPGADRPSRRWARCPG